MSPRRRLHHLRSSALDPAVHHDNVPDPSGMSSPTSRTPHSTTSTTAATPHASDEKKSRIPRKGRVAVWIGSALAIAALSRDRMVGSLRSSTHPRARDFALGEMAGTLPPQTETVVKRRQGIDIIATAPSSTSSSSSSSPACRPHFKLALPDGTWTNASKFKRLYFYHVRKAGVSRYCCMLLRWDGWWVGGVWPFVFVARQSVFSFV